jgi:O-antigen/teichoic acid export membrane protein
LNATGRVKTTLKLMVFWTVLTWILTPLLVFKVGFNGVALAALLVSSTVFLPIMLVKKFINFFLWENAGKPFLGALGMGIVLKLIIPKFTFNLFSLAIIVIIGVVTYFFLMFALAKEKILESIKLVLRSFKE